MRVVFFVDAIPVNNIFCIIYLVSFWRTHEDERTVLFKTVSLDGIKLNTNPKTKPNPKPKLTLVLTLFSCFMLFSSTVL